MSGNGTKGKNNGWHLKNGESAAESSVVGDEKGEGMERDGEGEEGEEREEKAAPVSTRKRARSSGSTSNGSELSTDSHGAKRFRVIYDSFNYDRFLLFDKSHRKHFFPVVVYRGARSVPSKRVISSLAYNFVTKQ
jgi:hypothetical protein